MSNPKVDDYFNKFAAHPENEATILVEAALDLTGKELATLKDRIGKKKAKTEQKGKDKEATSTTSGTEFVDVEEPRNTAEEQKAVEQFWVELEKLDPITLISDDVIDAFKYVGFDPDTVLREMLFRGRKAGKNKDQIQQDLINMVTLAIIKGSVTETNLKKTSDAGKVLYKKLQDGYKLETGGAKGKDSTHLTAARVAAAVPGLVTQVLVKRPEFAKTFIGPFGSKVLPPYLRHQAAAACIPESSSDKLREYILGIITAFTADQTKTLSKTKDSAEELFDRQQGFVYTTFNSKHPSEATRSKIFGTFSLSSDFEKLDLVAKKIKKIKTDFIALTQQELDAELTK